MARHAPQKTWSATCCSIWATTTPGGPPGRLKRGDTSLHLAVLTTPFLNPLLNGIKIIEARPRWQL
jgi:hypothetical protein